MVWKDIDEDQNNLWYKVDSCPITFVFVHGFLSDSRSCWNSSSDSSGEFWPDILSSDPRFGRIDIYLGGYYTEVDSGDYDIQQCSLELLSALQTQDEHGGSVLERPAIIFVCHSLGGIVVRHLLVYNQHLFRDKVIGLALIASPSLGSDYADVLSGLTKFYGNRVGRALKRQSAILDTLDTQFRILADERRTRMPCLEGAEACEMQGMLHFKYWPRRWTFPPLVKADAMGKYFGAPRSIAGTDHSSIAKPTSSKHPSHRFLVDFYTNKVIPRLEDCLGLDPDAVQIDTDGLPHIGPQTVMRLTFKVKEGQSGDPEALRRRIEQLIKFAINGKDFL